MKIELNSFEELETLLKMFGQPAQAAADPAALAREPAVTIGREELPWGDTVEVTASDPEPAQEETPTLEQVRALAQRVLKEDRNRFIAALAKFDVPKVVALKPEQYRPFMEALA